MSKKKNNAMEKVENISSEVQANDGNAEKRDAENKRDKMRAEKRKAKLKKEKEREKRERKRAEEKMRAAEIKAHRKAERQKAKATRLREKKRIKAEKQRLAAEKRAAAEEEKLKLREQKLAAQATKTAEVGKSATANENKGQKASPEAKDKARRNDRTGLKAAVVALSAAVVLLGGALAYVNAMPDENDTSLEAVYRRSFYDAVEQVDNIDLNLSKIISTGDEAAMQDYLLDLAVNSEVAENDLQTLPLHDENKYYTTKLVNQIGDFAKYLNGKLVDGESVSAEDRENLKTLYTANAELKDSLRKMSDGISENGDFRFTAMNGGNNLLTGKFDELQNLSVQYPELIYDGPFSDGQNDREIKGLYGEEITEAEARDVFGDLFGERGLSDIKTAGSVNGEIECYNVSAKTPDSYIYAQISKIGGKMILFDVAGSCRAVNYSADNAEKRAIAFLEKQGFDNMEAVWTNLSNNVYTINFAYKQDGVIVYGDLVKVRVCAETGDVIGMEAKSYYTNHTERNIGTAKLTKAQAVTKVSDNITVEGARIALIPIGNTSEKLCYEFVGTAEDSTFYVYIDAVSGRQIQMFKVIDSNEGLMLM